MLYDKLSVINSCLLLSGNNVCAFEGEDTTEWLIGSGSYEKRLPEVLDSHDWNFATQIAPLVRVGDSPDPRFSDAFARPSACLSVIGVWITYAAISSGVSYDYVIINNQILMNAPGLAPQCKYLLAPPDDRWPPLFIKALDAFVMSDIYRGLNDDVGEADKLEAKAEVYLQQARSRADQQVPARALTNSRMLARRHVRRGGFPWPINGQPGVDG